MLWKSRYRWLLDATLKKIMSIVIISYFKDFDK